jgi:drug/metabolite transporter (DMT)-like permease
VTYLLLLVMVTAVWGATFVLVKDAISHYPTLPFLSLRFVLAALVLLVALRRLPDRRTALVGLPIGAALAAGYFFQTVGLQYTSPGNAGLLTGLFVVFTPILDGVFGAAVPLRTWLAAIAALAGTLMLTGGGFRLPGLGDLLVIGCAVAFAGHIVLLGRFAPGAPPAPLALVQMTVAAAGFTFAATPGGIRLPPVDVWWALAITGVLASALGFLVQTWAQGHLSASRTALVLATEPAWALAAAIVLAGQRFGLLEAAGAAVILVAIVGHEAVALRQCRA